MKAKAISSLLLICLFFSACGTVKYSDGIECEEITSALQQEISALEGYSAYSSDDVGFMFDENLHFDDYSIIYSISGDDIGEVGVLHAESEEEAQNLLEQIRDYVNGICADKGAFVENYLPEECGKLDSADAKRFGNYVIFAFLEATDRDAVFEISEKILK